MPLSVCDLINWNDPKTRAGEGISTIGRVGAMPEISEKFGLKCENTHFGHFAHRAHCIRTIENLTILQKIIHLVGIQPQINQNIHLLGLCNAWTKSEIFENNLMDNM